MSCNCGNKSSMGFVIPSVSQAIRGIIPASKAILNLDNASGDIIKSRLDICRHCEFATRNSAYTHVSQGLTNFSQCMKCSCIILLKVRGNNSACPLLKW